MTGDSVTVRPEVATNYANYMVRDIDLLVEAARKLAETLGHEINCELPEVVRQGKPCSCGAHKAQANALGEFYRQLRKYDESNFND